ncbi:MAG: TIR domain-containing protein [Snodgrassella sp.]|nr:TIR domain-containing protein [Snodgrassella sp.]
MGYKVFISYKYLDNSVRQLSPLDIFNKTTARDYVDIIQKKFERDGIHINKGEKDDESLDHFKEETIQSKLADKIFDSSVTIVLISPDMKDSLEEENQWIPWEIAYSLRSKQRSEKRSKRNAILLVILPDRNDSYDYVNSCGFYFNIIQRNLNNLHTPYYACKLENGCSKSYMLRCNWDKFISKPNAWIDAAIEIRDNGDKYTIVVRP